MALFIPKTVFLVGITVVIASCSNNKIEVDGQIRDLTVRYGQDAATPENGSLIEIGDSYTQAFRQATNNLRKSGFTIESSDIQTGQIRVAYFDNETIDCGSLATGPESDLTIFAANSALVALEVPAEGGGSTFVLQNVNVNSTASISIGIDPARVGKVYASVSEQHRVQLIVKQASDNTVISDQVIDFSGHESAEFRRGLECGSARYVREVLTSN